jgi:uncharacterized glyoxalase superfamily protein PhnB
VVVKIEHFALQVPDPVAMADWYVANLGFSVRRSGGEPARARFMIYRNPKTTVPDYDAMNPLQLHLAFVSGDPAADRDRLVKAGARIAEDLTTSAAGDQLVMLRDPWGVPLQLVKRRSPMLPV